MSALLIGLVFDPSQAAPAGLIPPRSPRPPPPIGDLAIMNCWRKSPAAAWAWCIARADFLEPRRRVKVLLFGQFASDQFVKRFRGRSRGGRSLRHPNIVAIHEIGELSGQHYFSMDYVDGPSLAEMGARPNHAGAEGRPLPEIIAEAVEYAHAAASASHLKPSNVLVDASDQAARDGLRLANGCAATTNSPCRQVLGSPSFMPPEQAASDCGPVGPGAMLFPRRDFLPTADRTASICGRVP